MSLWDSEGISPELEYTWGWKIGISDWVYKRTLYVVSIKKTLDVPSNTTIFLGQLPNVGNVEIGQTTSPWTCPFGFVKSAGALLIRYCWKKSTKRPLIIQYMEMLDYCSSSLSKNMDIFYMFFSLEMIFLQFPLEITGNYWNINIRNMFFGTLSHPMPCQDSLAFNSWFPFGLEFRESSGDRLPWQKTVRSFTCWMVSFHCQIARG